jgi:hypothetical protein
VTYGRVLPFFRVHRVAHNGADIRSLHHPRKLVLGSTTATPTPDPAYFLPARGVVLQQVDTIARTANHRLA